MLNGCRYCIASHTGLLKGVYNFSDEEFVELAAVVGHVNGLSFLEKATFSELFEVPNSSNETLREVEKELGYVPNFFRLVANDPKLLSIIWEREKVTMLDGRIERWIKELVALCISLSNSCYENATLRMNNLKKLNISKDAILEGLWVAERFEKNTKITEGLLLETSPDELHVIKNRNDQL